MAESMSGDQPELARLWGRAGELRDALAEKEEQLKEHCKVAANEEAKVVGRRLSTELDEMKAHTQTLEQRSERDREKLAQRAAELQKLEEHVHELEAQEETWQAREEQWRTLQNEISQMGAAQRSCEAELRATLKQEQADFLQNKSLLEREEHECKRLEASNMAEEALQVGSTVEGLEAQLEKVQEHLLEFSRATEQLQGRVVEREENADRLLAESLQLEAVAAERDADVELQSELHQSEEHVQFLARRNARLQRADHVAGTLVEQLEESDRFSMDIETALATISSEVYSAKLPAAPQSWLEEKEELQVQITAVEQAERQANLRAAGLESELMALRALPHPSLPRVSTSHTEAPQPGSGLGESLCLQVQEAIQRAEAALDAKGRRLQLLMSAALQADVPPSLPSGSRASVSAEVNATESRLSKLEALAEELAAQAEEGDREVESLESKKREREGMVHRKSPQKSPLARYSRTESPTVALRGLASHAHTPRQLRGAEARPLASPPGQLGSAGCTSRPGRIVDGGRPQKDRQTAGGEVRRWFSGTAASNLSRPS